MAQQKQNKTPFPALFFVLKDKLKTGYLNRQNMEEEMADLAALAVAQRHPFPLLWKSLIDLDEGVQSASAMWPCCMQP
jgi:hypothetical protein